MAHIITETMDATMDFAKAKIYITNWKNIEAFFKKETLEEVLKEFKVRDFATFEYIPKENVEMYNHYIEKGYVLITPKPVSAPYKEYMDYKGKSWETTNYRLCYEFVVRDSYQLNESKLVKKALTKEFPYLKDFAISVYYMDKPATEKGIEAYKQVNAPYRNFYNFYGNDIYIKTTNEKDFPNKSIYVPMLALKNKDIQMIIDYHTCYFKDYYRNAGKEKYLAQALSLLDTPIAKKFFECVENNY